MLLLNRPVQWVELPQLAKAVQAVLALTLTLLLKWHKPACVSGPICSSIVKCLIKSQGWRSVTWPTESNTTVTNHIHNLYGCSIIYVLAHAHIVLMYLDYSPPPLNTSVTGLETYLTEKPAKRLKNSDRTVESINQIYLKEYVTFYSNSMTKHFAFTLSHVNLRFLFQNLLQVFGLPHM